MNLRMYKLFGKELNTEETFVGAWIQGPFYFIIGWWVLILMPISGLLWALGGAKNSNKAWRRWGVPIISNVAVIACNAVYWPTAWSVVPMWGAMTLGYGGPDEDGTSSALYSFYSRFIKAKKIIDFCVRLTTYILFWIGWAIAAGITMDFVRSV